MNNKKVLFLMLSLVLFTLLFFNMSVKAYSGGSLLSITGDYLKWSCVDTDLGINYFLKGAVFYHFRTYQDSCLDKTTLKEYYCSKGAAAYTVYPCSGGCENGACMRKVNQKIECKPGQRIGDVNGDGVINVDDAVLAGKIAVGLVNAPSDLCCVDINHNAEVDEGDVALIKEMITGKYTSPGKCGEENSCVGEGQSLGPVIPGNNNVCCAGLSAISNSRPNANGVCEVVPGGRGYCTYCGNGNCESPENKCNCPQDCKEEPTPKPVCNYDGKCERNLGENEQNCPSDCANPQPTYCKDSDGGLNYYVAGYAVGSDGISRKDFCVGDKGLYEAYCFGGKVMYKYHTCDMSCQNGACVKGPNPPPVCNHNGVCEKNLGENEVSCPSDCRKELNSNFYVNMVKPTDNEILTGGNDYTLTWTHSGLDKNFGYYRVVYNCKYPKYQSAEIAKVYSLNANSLTWKVPNLNLAGCNVGVYVYDKSGAIHSNNNGFVYTWSKNITIKSKLLSSSLTSVPSKPTLPAGMSCYDADGGDKPNILSYCIDTRHITYRDVSFLGRYVKEYVCANVYGQEQCVGKWEMLPDHQVVGKVVFGLFKIAQ